MSPCLPLPQGTVIYLKHIPAAPGCLEPWCHVSSLDFVPHTWNWSKYINYWLNKPGTPTRLSFLPLSSDNPEVPGIWGVFQASEGRITLIFQTYRLSKLSKCDKIRLTGPKFAMRYHTAANSKAHALAYCAWYCTSQLKKAEIVVQDIRLSQQHYNKRETPSFTVGVCQRPCTCSKASGCPMAPCMALLEVHSKLFWNAILTEKKELRNYNHIIVSLTKMLCQGYFPFVLNNSL